MTDNLIFAIYPNAKGFGYACMEDSNNLVDFGIANINPINNQKILLRIEKMLDFYKPSIVLLPKGKHGKRVSHLLKHIQSMVEHHHIVYYRYTREDIQNVFEQCKAQSKYEIAVQLTSVFPQLESWLPNKRGTADPESYTTAIFDALSLITVYQYLESDENAVS